MSQSCALATVKANCILGYTRKSLAAKERDVVCFPTHSINDPASGALCLISPPALPSTGERLTNGRGPSKDLLRRLEGCSM